MEKFKATFYDEAMKIFGNMNSNEDLSIEELKEILLMEKRKIKDCTTKAQIKTLCVQLIAENKALSDRLKSIAKLVEENLNG